MSTTNKNFVVETASNPVSAVAVSPTFAGQLVSNQQGEIVDVVNVNLASGGYAKNGMVYLTLTGTTPVSLDLTALGSNTVYAGDVAFANWNQLVFNNTGAQDLVVSPNVSNGARLLLGGTSPTITVPAGSAVTLESVANVVIDSTHKSITITPTAGGSMAVCVGGS
jgi:hypothetical protein